jgi:flagellar biosynthesis protein FlhB
MPESGKGFTDSFKETLATIKNKAEKDGVVRQGYDLILYFVLLVGLIVSFFNVLWGALLVGAVVGVAFYSEAIQFFRNLKNWIEIKGMAKSLVLGGLLLFFIIVLPTGVIAAIAAILIRAMINPPLNR